MKQTAKIFILSKCKKCGGTGWIPVDKEGNIVYRKCECVKLKQAKEIWNRSGINIEQTNMSFNNYKTYNEITKIMKKMCVGYFKCFDEVKSNRNNSLALLGQVGCGKTHLSISVAINLLKKNIPVIYMPYRDDIIKIKQNMLNQNYYEKTIDKYKKAHVLLIDDLFKGKIMESDINIVFQIINYRYLNYLPIIVSSENTAEELLSIDEAIGSRILEMCKNFIVEIRGKENNYRLNM